MLIKCVDSDVIMTNLLGRQLVFNGSVTMADDYIIVKNNSERRSIALICLICCEKMCNHMTAHFLFYYMHILTYGSSYMVIIQRVRICLINRFDTLAVFQSSQFMRQSRIRHARH